MLMYNPSRMIYTHHKLNQIPINQVGHQTAPTVPQKPLARSGGANRNQTGVWGSTGPAAFIAVHVVPCESMWLFKGFKSSQVISNHVFKCIMIMYNPSRMI